MSGMGLMNNDTLAPGVWKEKKSVGEISRFQILGSLLTFCTISSVSSGI